MITTAELARIRAIAEADRDGADGKAWDEAITPNTVIALCDRIEKQQDALNLVELREGRVYRGKNPRCCDGYINDRHVLRLNERMVQYDGPAVAPGRHYPMVSVESFLNWADRDVTDELPNGAWQPWRKYEHNPLA